MKIRQRTLLLLVVAIASIGCLPFLTPEERAIVWPGLAMLFSFLSAFVILWNRDGRLPLFDVGVVCLAFTCCYAVLPLIQFLLSGMQWTILSDTRLYNYDPTPEQFGAFAWMPATYLASMAAAYVSARGRAPTGFSSMEAPGRTRIIAILGVSALIVGFFVSYYLLTGVDVSLNPDYEAQWAAIATGTLQAVPLFVQQISHNLYGMLMILKYALVLALLRHWDNKWSRPVLILWLLAEGIFTVINMGSRSWFVFLLLSVLLSYHRLIKPLRLSVLAAVSVALLCGALAYGYIRDYKGVSIDIDPDVSMLSAATEFQVLYGTPFDLLKKIEEGSLPPVPWQVYLSDVLMLVPQQLLPIQKMDPSGWYLDLIGLRGSGLGLMFGVLSQAVIGLGWIEVILRGAITGLILALIHRWYVKNSSGFWATLLYLWLCLWSYYSYRATTFYVLTFLVYRFLPAYLLVTLGSRWLGKRRRPIPGSVSA